MSLICYDLVCNTCGVIGEGEIEQISEEYKNFIDTIKKELSEMCICPLEKKFIEFNDDRYIH